MSRLLLMAGAVTLLGACSTPFGFGGEDWAGDTGSRDVQNSPETDTSGGTDPSSDSVAGYVLASRSECTDLAGEGLFVDVNGDQAWVVHDGFATGCGAEWTVTCVPEADDRWWLDITYTKTDTSDCDCSGWRIEYILDDLADGTYTLEAGDQTVAFTVGLLTE